MVDSSRCCVNRLLRAVWINIIAYLVGTLIWLATFGTLSLGFDLATFCNTQPVVAADDPAGDTCLPQWVNALIFTIVVVWFTSPP